MKVRRLYKCQLCGRMHVDAGSIDIPEHSREQTKETYEKLHEILKESFYVSCVCFCEDGRIGQCLFAGFENVEEAEEKPEA